MSHYDGARRVSFLWSFLLYRARLLQLHGVAVHLNEKGVMQ